MNSLAIAAAGLILTWESSSELNNIGDVETFDIKVSIDGYERTWLDRPEPTIKTRALMGNEVELCWSVRPVVNGNRGEYVDGMCFYRKDMSE